MAKKKPRPPSTPLTPSQVEQVREMLAEAEDRVVIRVCEILERVDRTRAAAMWTVAGRQAIEDAGGLTDWALNQDEPVSPGGKQAKAQRLARIEEIRGARRRGEEALLRSPNDTYVPVRERVLGQKQRDEVRFANGVRADDGDES